MRSDGQHRAQQQRGEEGGGELREMHGDPAAQPAPIRPPTSPCVVETGIPIRVASRTVSPAPSATAAT